MDASPQDIDVAVARLLHSIRLPDSPARDARITTDQIELARMLDTSPGQRLAGWAVFVLALSSMLSLIVLALIVTGADPHPDGNMAVSALVTLAGAAAFIAAGYAADTACLHLQHRRKAPYLHLLHHRPDKHFRSLNEFSG